MLMVVEPVVDGATGAVAAKTSFLSPAFEEGRVRMLGIPARGELDIVTWEEHWNPYKTLRESRLFAGRENVSIMVDEEMRDYIVRGLQANGFETVGLRGEVEAVRQIKTPAEIELIRAVNTGTVEAVRAMRPCELCLIFFFWAKVRLLMRVCPCRPCSWIDRRRGHGDPGQFDALHRLLSFLRYRLV